MNKKSEISTSSSVAITFQKQAEKYSTRAVVAYKENNVYRDISWQDLNTMVTDTACYLLSIGIKKGDRVGINSLTRYEWWIADLAILSINAVSVPVHATNSAEETRYVLDHSNARACFCGSSDDLKNLVSIESGLKNLQTIVTFDTSESKNKKVVSLKDAMISGSKSGKVQLFKKRLGEINPEDTATFMYTSGTTGDPKAVMLTHANFHANVNQVYSEVKDYINEDDSFLSFMPLSHSLERTCGYYFPISAGCKVYFAENLTTIIEDLQTVRPTIIISAPRIYEKIHGAILSKAAESSPLKKALFNFAVSAAKKNLPYTCQNKKRGGLFAIHYSLAHKLVLGKVKRAIGLDNLKFAISGGGPLSVSDANFFLGMGLKIMEGYGLTETTPVTNFNRPWLIKPGTVGPAAQYTDIKISEEDGEILVKGPQVMKGYYNNRAATEEAFNSDGYFRTGDIGSIDSDGYLSITGRIKDIIVTAGGKNISPQNIENSIKESPFIEQIAIIGDRRKYLSALVLPSLDEVRRHLKKTGVDFINDSEIADDERVKKIISEEIEKHTSGYSRVEKIKKFAILTEEWTQASGELTPSLKVKRRVIEKKYSHIIDALYPD